MNLWRWMWLYFLTGPSFTRWAILAFYGGGVVVLALVLLGVAIGVADGVSIALR